MFRCGAADEFSKLADCGSLVTWRREHFGGFGCREPAVITRSRRRNRVRKRSAVPYPKSYRRGEQRTENFNAAKESASLTHQARRSLIECKISTMTSARGLAPRLPL